MLVLLPPSEAKTSPASGAPLNLAALSSSQLTAHRTLVLDALIKVSAHPDAVDLLGVGPSLALEVDRNTRLRTQPTAPASAVYSGVLYAAAGLSDLPDDAARIRADHSVRIVSALWGLVQPTDPIPAYRLSMGTHLPGIGPLARSWRLPLAAQLDGRADELIVDCRSAPYAAAWVPPVGAHAWVTVRVLRELAGRRTVVSHHAKHTRGLLTRHLVVRRGPEPETPAELLAAATELVGTHLLAAELTPGKRGSAVLSLTVEDPQPPSSIPPASPR